MAESIEQIFARYPRSDKGTVHSYLPVYDRSFAPIRETVRTVVEIGVASGDSVRAWRDYFPHADIIGIDNGGEGLAAVSGPRIELVTADVNDPEQLVKQLGLERGFDIVIDDGNHHPISQAAAFGWFWPQVCAGGIYVIEDVASISTARDMAMLLRGTVEDLRAVKGRYDDLLVWFRKKNATS